MDQWAIATLKVAPGSWQKFKDTYTQGQPLIYTFISDTFLEISSTNCNDKEAENKVNCLTANNFPNNRASDLSYVVIAADNKKNVTSDCAEQRIILYVFFVLNLLSTIRFI